MQVPMHKGVMVGKSLGWVWERELTNDRYGRGSQAKLQGFKGTSEYAGDWTEAGGSDVAQDSGWEEAG